MRRLFPVVVLAFAVAGFATAAENYPNRPIRYIVPFPPGGITDMMARTVGSRVSANLRQSVVVDNRAGGNALIGAAIAAKAPADGYTWFGMTITHTINVALFPDAPYDLLRDFTAVSVLGSLPLVAVIHPGVPAKTLADLTALGRTRILNGGSSGNGSPQHLALELYRRLAGVQIQHVPFKGGAPSMVSLIGGELDLLITGLPECIAHVRSGKLRALAIASSARHPLVPDIPTTAEAGQPALAITSWTGLMIQRATPKPIVKRIHAEVARALAEPDVAQRVREQGFTLVANAPDEAQAFMTTEVERWSKLVREAKIRPD